MGGAATAYDLSTSGVKHVGTAAYCGGVAFDTGAAVVKVWDSATASSVGALLLDVFDVAANVAVNHDLGRGVYARLGIYVEVVSGSPEGSVRIA